MRKRRIPDIRECMTAVTVEYRSRRPEIETEIFVPFGLHLRFGRYVRIGFPARIEHRNTFHETCRTDVGHTVCFYFGGFAKPKASSRRTRVFCRSFISGVRKSIGSGRSGNVAVHSGYENVSLVLSFAPDFSAGYRYGCVRLSPCRPCYGSASFAMCPVPSCPGIG